MITDAAPGAYRFQAQSAYSQAVTNTSGANLTVAGGLGRRLYTSISNTLGAVTVTTTVDGTAVALASGVDFTLGSDNTAPQLGVTATNLAAAINANGTLSAKLTATASAAKVFVDKLAPTVSIVIATNQSGRISITSGTDGTVLLAEGVAAKPSFAFIGSLTSGFYTPASGQISMTLAGAESHRFTSTQFSILNNGALIRLGASVDVILSRAAAANWQLGTTDAAAPVAQTLSPQNVVAGTTDTAGANFTIGGSKGTGTGVGGSVIVSVSPAGTTGSTQNALAAALTIDSTKLANFAGFVRDSGVSRVSVQFDKTNDTALAAITGLSSTVLAGSSYSFTITLHITTGAVSGEVVDLGGGTASATAVISQVKVLANTTNVYAETSRQTSLTGASAGVAGDTSYFIEIKGLITVNAAGTFKPRIAQKVSNGTATSVLVGSTMILRETP
jgi:hypothetical protein